MHIVFTHYFAALLQTSKHVQGHQASVEEIICKPLLHMCIQRY